MNLDKAAIKLYHNKYDKPDSTADSINNQNILKIQAVFLRHFQFALKKQIK